MLTPLSSSIIRDSYLYYAYRLCLVSVSAWRLFTAGTYGPNGAKQLILYADARNFWALGSLPRAIGAVALTHALLFSTILIVSHLCFPLAPASLSGVAVWWRTYYIAQFCSEALVNAVHGFSAL